MVRLCVSIAALAAGLVTAAAVWAQAEPKEDVIFMANAEPGVECGAGVVFDRAVGPGPGGRGLQVKATTGAPYSAVGTTTMTRTLVDGNRIVHTNTMRYMRDGLGRSRTEYSLAALGPIALGETHTMIVIDDPVAHRQYVLHPERKRADELDTQMMFTPFGAATVAMGPGRGAVVSGIAVSSAPAASTATAGVPVPPPPSIQQYAFVSRSTGAMPLPPACGSATMETRRLPAPVSLGERTIEGVKVIGSRHEFEIAAGSIGNEQPIRVRSEQWFSPELGVVVESTHNDPLMGDTTYRLSQIRRGEPDAALFKVPAGYTTEKVQPPKFEVFESPPGRAPQE